MKPRSGANRRNSRCPFAAREAPRTGATRVDGSIGRSKPASIAPSSAFSAAAALGLAITLWSTTAVAANPDSVFHIDRNKNRNQVHYGVHVDDRCQPVGDEPVYNYWLRREENPPVVQPLKYIQQAAYGFQKQNIESDGRIEVRLRALPDRQLVVRVASVGGGCKAETFMTIGGKQAYLDKVFVFAEEGILLPTVRYIELFGRSNDGLAVYEKITVDE